MKEESEKTDGTTIQGGANRKNEAGNLGDGVPNETDNVLRMGAAALTGMGAESQVADMSSGGNGFMAIGGSEGYTGDETSGGGADPYGNEAEAGSGTGSGVGAGAGAAGGGNDSANEEGYDREADGGGGAGLGTGGLRRGDGNRPDTSVSPGGVESED